MISRHARFLLIAGGGVVLFRFLYAAVFTVIQYLVWKRDEFSQFLLPPHQPLGYFLHYSWSHFWFSPVLSFGSAALFTSFLFIVRKYRPVLLREGETELTFLAAAIVGWPKIVVFIPLVFIILAVMVFYAHFCSPGSRTTIAPAIIAAGLLGFFFGGALLDFFGLAALTV